MFSSQQDRQLVGQTKHTSNPELQQQPGSQVADTEEKRASSSRQVSMRMTIFYYLLVFTYLTFARMPKVIDKYVLEEKIGNGQFGQVFKGRHQDTLEVVAIKTIRRDMIKGKFYELLENEIKVLKTCDNPHIIKLIALKKTPHNYYLMLEYCNGGDMLARVKQEGKLPQELVLKYFCQILNAFQTLTTHKIMHRDFKLANILLHNGQIKIADFGFAKLLAGEDYTSTMLGSPLNMAPQVLGNSKYNSKADIWSIGACIYEMIYGKPPYVAGNMVDLLKLIKAKPLVLPKEPLICAELADALKKMLVADVKHRVQWHELFKHPVNTVLTKKRLGQAELQLVENQSLMINTSKCYLKNNLVLSDVNAIKQNSQVNDYLVDIIRTGKKPAVKEEQPEEEYTPTAQDLEKEKWKRNNSKIILHFRNIYAFIASVADQVINRTIQEHHEIAAYVLVRKILSMIEWLVGATSGPECPIQGIQNWKIYAKEPEFLEIREYLLKQRDVFSVFNQSLEPIIKKKAIEGTYESDVRELLTGTLKATTYIKYLRLFLRQLAKAASLRALQESNLLGGRQDWKLLFFGLKIAYPQQSFGRSDSEFDFKGFYQCFESIQQENMLLQVQKMLNRLEK